MNKFLHRCKITILAPCLLALGACYHTNVAEPSLKDPVARNSVQMVRLPHEITAEDDRTDSLSRMTMTTLAGFFTSIEVGYADVIMLDGPDVSDGRIAAIASYVNQQGLIYAGTSALGAKPKAGSVVLYVERYIVATPTCGEWLPEFNNSSRNNDSAFHGCASTANLGLMIANPRDLISGQNSGTSTAAAVGALYTPKAAAPATGAPELTLSVGDLQAMANAQSAAK